jgi:hypothetical protein
MVVGFKAFDKGLVCRGFQFEEGKTYEHKGDFIPCNSGFHFCENPLDVLNYYDLCNSEFAIVEAVGEVKKEDNKSVTNKLKIGIKLNLPRFIKASIEYVSECCKQEQNTDNNKKKSQLSSSGDSAKLASSGEYAKLASSGEYAQLASSGDSAKLASSGDSAKLASSGEYAKLASSGYSAKLASIGEYAQLASSGDSAKLASSGDYAKLASSGEYAQLAVDGKYSVVAGIGINNKIKGITGTWITLAEWEYDNSINKQVPLCVKSSQIDGEILKENIYYKLENGEFVEV